MGPKAVLVAEGLVTVWAGCFFLLRVSDLEMFLEVGSVADRLVAHWAWPRLVRVVFCKRKVFGI